MLGSILLNYGLHNLRVNILEIAILLVLAVHCEYYGRSQSGAASYSQSRLSGATMTSFGDN